MESAKSINRREMLKLSLAAGGAAILLVESVHAKAGVATAVNHPTGGRFDPPSPPITPSFWVDLPRIPIKTVLPGGLGDLRLPGNGGVEPNGTVYPQVSGNDALTTYMNSPERIVAAQQRNSGSNIQFPPKHFYVLRAQEALQDFHPEMTARTKDPKGTVVWGYDGMYPGPTFVSHYGQPVLVRIINEIFFDENGNRRTPAKKMPGNFGNAQISTHLHNGHSASESDGNPTDFYPPHPIPGHLPPYPASIQNLRFRDHHYAMFRAGLDPRNAATKNDGDTSETVSTLWYHDHAMDHTAANVYAGLVGFHLFFDEWDSGDEKDPNPKALRLPSGKFDIPLLIQDKRFDESGQLVLPDPNFDNCSDPTKCFRLGVLGDRFVVNGKIQPKLEVSRRKYRFRLLNAGPSRFYQFFLTKNDQDQAFIQIGNDESLLEAPFNVPADKGVLVSVSERADIVIDFSKFNVTDQLYLVNRLVMFDEGFGPKLGTLPGTYETLPPGQGDKILRFDVVDDLPEPGPGDLPEKLRDNPKLPVELKDVPPDQLKLLPNHRMFEFGIQNDGQQPKWLINGVEFDPSPTGSPKAPDGKLRPVGCHTTPPATIIYNCTRHGVIMSGTVSIGATPAAAPPKIVEAKVGDVWQPSLLTAVVGDVIEWRMNDNSGVTDPMFPGHGVRILNWDAVKDYVDVETVPGQQPFNGDTGRNDTESKTVGQLLVRLRIRCVPPAKLCPLAACPVMPRAGLPGELMHDGEVWTIRNTGGWAHPVHIHLEEFRILWRNGEKPPLPERSKKDVLRLDPNEEVQIFMRFRDFYGKYPIHCHNVLHEDHEMMLRFDVVGDS